MSYNRNVFINCPFDSEYKKLIQPLLFALVYCELEPKISETSDSGSNRFENIKSIINSSKFSIHDLSRMEAMHHGELPRFNLPYELGLDIGCKSFSKGSHKEKKILIFEKEKFRYQKVLSDISGFDIYAHSNNQRQLVFQLRNWLQFHLKKVPSGSQLWEDFSDFKIAFEEHALIVLKYSLDELNELPVVEFIRYVKEWLTNKHFIS